MLESLTGHIQWDAFDFSIIRLYFGSTAGAWLGWCMIALLWFRLTVWVSRAYLRWASK